MSGWGIFELIDEMAISRCYETLEIMREGNIEVRGQKVFSQYFYDKMMVKHLLPSKCNKHLMQLCNNFKSVKHNN